MVKFLDENQDVLETLRVSETKYMPNKTQDHAFVDDFH